MKHPILAKRLIEISEALLKCESNDASEIFGYPDDMKLKSSMTLFALVSDNTVFKEVLNKFFGGEMDGKTIQLLKDN